MTIVHILNFFYPRHSAGTEKYVLQLSKEQKLNKHKPIVVIPGYEDVNSYTYEGIEVRKYKEDKTATKKAFLGLEASSGASALKELLQLIKPDIVHFHELGNGNGISYYHFNAVYELDIKIVFTPHLATLTCANGKMFYRGSEHCDGKINLWKCTKCCVSEKVTNSFMQNFVTLASVGAFSLFGASVPKVSLFPMRIKQKENELKRMVQNVSSFCVLSPWYKEVLLKNNVSEEKIKVIKQATPLQDLSEATKKEENREVLKLIFVGRITSEKGLHLLIDALINVDFPFILSVVGKVIEENYYHLCVETAKLNNLNIKWLGVKSSSDVADLMKKHDALVLPSYFSEMSPLVIQEAFSVGLPVIASNAPGNQDQIQHGVNGLLFKFGDKNNLAEQINYFNFHKGNFKRIAQFFLERDFVKIETELMSVYKG